MEIHDRTKWKYCREIFDGDCPDEEAVQKTEEILDFANMVFSMEYGGTDFAALLPKAYAEERCKLLTHHMITERNKIRALIDTYPVVLRLAGDGSALKAAYVGTVAVHPGSRGRGYMIELMGRVEEDALRQGCALMILDGDRHRYQYYGFERAGIRYRFQIEIGNIIHCCANLYDKAYMASPAYSFEELGEQSPYLDCLYGLYQGRIVTARSREDFWLCLQSYHAAVYAILRDGKPVGYMNVSADGNRVQELELDAVQELPRVLYDMMMGFDRNQIEVSVGMDETDKIDQLGKACDCCNAAMSHQIKILDYQIVLEFLLRWKHRYHTLVRSDYVVGVRDGRMGRVENYLLSVTRDGISVSRTERSPDTILEPLELVRLLTTTLCFTEQQKGGQGKLQNAPSGWFPLPFYLPEADTF